MDIHRGTQVIGVWGAMVSESHGFIASIETSRGMAGTAVRIQWDNGSSHHAMISEIQDNYLDNNQVGLYVNPFTEELM